MSRSVKVSACNLSLGALLAIAGTACSRDARRQATNRSSTPIDTAAVAAPTASPAPPSGRRHSLIGLAYGTLPSGVTFVSGAAIPSNTGAPSFDLAQVKTPEGDRLLLQTNGPKIGGAASHLVVADLDLPPIGATESLAMASCDVNGKLDPAVVAVVANEPNATRLTKVRQAWRANVDAKRFDVIPVDGVVCEQPDAG